ncbi:hypothetical protein Taro_053716 [Colocasia esculenta]|uniref:Uncharacterized protein n=1 Tax=Colocasia esculenta TaxID=4460 RepID=A0A843XLZ0_COLES|nr:hypothetical protein [Colocasia esculenta]
MGRTPPPCPLPLPTLFLLLSPSPLSLSSSLSRAFALSLPELSLVFPSLLSLSFVVVLPQRRCSARRYTWWFWCLWLHRVFVPVCADLESLRCFAVCEVLEALSRYGLCRVLLVTEWVTDRIDFSGERTPGKGRLAISGNGADPSSLPSPSPDPLPSPLSLAALSVFLSLPRVRPLPPRALPRVSLAALSLVRCGAAAAPLLCSPPEEAPPPPLAASPPPGARARRTTCAGCSSVPPSPSSSSLPPGISAGGSYRRWIVGGDPSAAGAGAGPSPPSLPHLPALQRRCEEEGGDPWRSAPRSTWDLGGALRPAPPVHCAGRWPGFLCGALRQQTPPWAHLSSVLGRFRAVFCVLLLRLCRWAGPGLVAVWSSHVVVGPTWVGSDRAGLSSRESVLVFGRSALCRLWSAALAVVVVQQDSRGSCRRVAVVAVLHAWYVVADWLVLVEVFLVWRTVADKSSAMLLVVIGCAFGFMCSVVAERVYLRCGLHWCRPVVCGSGGRCPYFSYLCLLLALLCYGCFGVLPHLLELFVVVFVRVSPKTVCVDWLFGLFVPEEFSLDDSLSFLVEVLSMAV